MNLKQKDISPYRILTSQQAYYRIAVSANTAFYFENVVAHSKVRIGDNVYVLPNTYLGHHSVIEDNCFIAAQVSLAGGVIIKKDVF